MAKRKILKALAKALGILAVAAALAVGAALYLMARKDAEHAKFFETGRSVNNFLSSYTKAVKEGFRKKDVSAVAALYSDHFASPARGRWVMRPDTNESDVVASRAVAEGGQDYLKAD